MKILILCKKFPYPLKEGEPIAIYNLSRSLQALGCAIDLFVLNTSKHYFDPKNLPAANNHYRHIYSIAANNHITLKGAFLNLFNRESYITSRFYSKAYEKQLISILQKNDYEVVQLETIYMAHYIPVVRQYSDALISVRAHNVEYLIWSRVIGNTKSILKRLYLQTQYKALKQFELSKINQADLLIAITKKDLDTFNQAGLKSEGIAVPVGIDFEEYKTDFQPTIEQLSIGFIGALDWMPNQDGIMWFLKKVWPKVVEKVPSLTLHIAGKNTPLWLMTKKVPNVTFYGEVPDAKSFIRAHPVFIAPLFSGSGIKIKILESMALGRITITTDIGLEGIPAKHGQHLFVANSASEFASAIIKSFLSDQDLLSMRKAAREFIQQEFNTLQITKKLFNKYGKLTSNNRTVTKS